jgi:hypothetical protein
MNLFSGTKAERARGSIASSSIDILSILFSSSIGGGGI